MFVNYDYSNFPEVKVTFTDIIKDESDFILFTQQWEKLYDDKKKFTFIFDVGDMGFVNPYWCYRIADFIGKMKEKPVHYLERSTIINVNTVIKYLLKIVFSIQSPISPVTIIYLDGTSSVINP